MADLAGFKTFQALDDGGSDAEKQLCLDAAKQFFGNAGVNEPALPNALYDLQVYRLAGHYYDHKTPGGMDPKEFREPFGIMGVILQMKDLGGE